MSDVNNPCSSSDLLNRRSAWLLWRIPIVLLVVGIFVDPTARTLMWAPALTIMGTACVVNATRCGRLHCYATGPLFLAAALAVVLTGLGWVAIPWVWIGIAVVVGTMLAYGLEWGGGQYASRA